MEPSWKTVLSPEFQKPYFKLLTEFVRNAYRSTTVYPAPSAIFEAFSATPFDRVKVVILGQDPYHGPNQAHGLAFSVQPSTPMPPSLLNMYKELIDDIGGGEIPAHGHLQHLAEQGVLLLNATLTVEAHKAGSHQGRGWEELTDSAVRALAERKKGLVFILWGSYAQKKGAFIDRTKHTVIESPHPSPLSAHRGFFGSKPFSRTNRALLLTGQLPIVWFPPNASE